MNDKTNKPNDDYGMSDEEFLAQGSPAPTPPEKEEETPVDTENTDDNTGDNTDTNTDTNTDEGKKPEDEEEKKKEEKPKPPKTKKDDNEEGVGNADDIDKALETSEENKKKEAPAGKEDKTKPETKKKEETKKEEKPVKNLDAPDYEKLYKKFIAPFKVKGREYHIKDAEEMRNLASKGIHYKANMEEWASKKPFVTALEEAGLLNDASISEMVDVFKNQNPKAIAKLLKRAKVDPISLDIDEETDKYESKSVVPSEAKANLEAALTSLQDYDGEDGILKDIQELWDKEHSIKKLKENPKAVVQMLMYDKSIGIYDKIVQGLANKQALGTLVEPFAVAYARIADKAREEYQQGKQTNTEETSTNSDKEGTPKIEDDAGNLDNDEKARSAGSPDKGAKTPPKKETAIDYFDGSDEEFLKKHTKKQW